MTTGPRVFIVDDSALVRQVLGQVLKDQGINVIGSAADPVFALAKMEKAWPDVIVLDMEMPRMDDEMVSSPLLTASQCAKIDHHLFEEIGGDLKRRRPWQSIL